MRDEKYDATALEKLLKEYLGDIKLSELLKPCLIPAYDIDRRSSHFFNQHDCALLGEGADFLVRDVCRATSAAPTYFEAAQISSLSGVSYPLVDGGVFANNPTLCAYSEIRTAKDKPTAEDMFIVSLGTGSQHLSYKYDQAKDWGKAGWVKPVLDIMMAGVSETTDYHLKQIFSAGGKVGNYIRLQPERMGNASLEMDNATDENIRALSEVGIETAQNCAPELDRIVEMLLKDPDPLEFPKSNE